MKRRPLSAVQHARGYTRELLNAILRDGNTVAQYRADAGVTGNLNASAWAPQTGAAPSLAQATGANRPIVLPFSGEKYGWLPGVASNFFSTPDSAANSITGDLCITVEAALDLWSSGVVQALVSKYPTTSAFNFYSSAVGGGYLNFDWWESGGTLRQVNSGASVLLNAGETAWVAVTLKLDNGAGGHEVKFWKSTDDRATWTQLGTTKNAGAFTTSLRDSPNKITVGILGDGVTYPTAGKFYRAHIYSGIPPMLGGSASADPVVDFNPTLWPESVTHGATFTASTGEVWTLENASGSKPAQIVGSASLLFDGANHFMNMAQSLPQPTAIYMIVRAPTHTNGDNIFDSYTADLMQLQQASVTGYVNMYAGSFSATQSQGLPVGAYHAICALFNGASSYYDIDATQSAALSCGASTSDGLTLGANPGGATKANIQVKEIIIRRAADDATTRAKIATYLKGIHGT